MESDCEMKRNCPEEVPRPLLYSLMTGVKCRCPRCGKGKLFEGLLKFSKQCSICSLNYDFQDIGDGASIFVMFAVGILLVPIAILFQVSFNPPFWLHIFIWAPLLTLSCIFLLRPVKGILLALQYRYNAEESRFD